MELLPFWYQYTLVFVLGLIVGSFLNVLIYRFHTGKSLSGFSHCLSCGSRLQWFELFPLLSYLFLRGRCRRCGCRIPSRYFWVELLSGGWFVWVYLQYGVSLMGVYTLLLGLLLLLITIYDIYHLVIPNELVATVGIGAAVYLGLLLYNDFSWSVLLGHLLAGVGAFGLYGGLWLVSKGRWIGLGDAKLALPMGCILGPLGTFSFVVLSFWVGAIVSIGMLLYPALKRVAVSVVQYATQHLRTCPQAQIVNYRRYFTMKSEVPFAPFMVIAFLLVYLCNVQVLSLMMGFV